MRGEPALDTRGLSVAFGGLQALDGVDIHAAPGEIVGVIGPNGAGKTTLFDAVCGYVPATGQVRIEGREVSGDRPERRAAAGLGRSFQDARLFSSLTVLETLKVAAELHLRDAGTLAAVLRLPRWAASERRATETADRLIEQLGLGPYAGKLVSELSTGTRRVVDLAAVLAREPSVLLFDEPSSGIAQREAEVLGPLLRDLRDRTGCAMLVIEHDMPLLLGLAERVYALALGRVIAEGHPDAVVHDPHVIESYLGTDPSAIARSGAAAGS